MFGELAELSPRQWLALFSGIVGLICGGIVIYLALAEMIRAILVAAGYRPPIQRADRKGALLLLPWVGGGSRRGGAEDGSDRAGGDPHDSGSGCYSGWGGGYDGGGDGGGCGD